MCRGLLIVCLVSVSGWHCYPREHLIEIISGMYCNSVSMVGMWPWLVEYADDIVLIKNYCLTLERKVNIWKRTFENDDLKHNL